MNNLIIKNEAFVYLKKLVCFKEAMRVNILKNKLFFFRLNDFKFKKLCKYE